MARIVMMVIALLLAQPAWGADPVTRARDLEGTWSAISAERDGAAASELIGHRIEFAGDHFQIAGKDGVLFGGSFTVAAAHIDFKIAEGAARGQSWAGIFRIENGLLTICDNAPDPSASRPREFGAPKGSGYVCLTFKR